MRKKVWLVQQGVWDMPVESMPLAMGYLKAVTSTDDVLRSELDVRVMNFRGGDTIPAMARRLFFEEVPDVVAFSVFGWNFQAFLALAETFRQFNPNGWVVFGGTHVAHQAKRVFGTSPAVDVLVDGEGELTFRELLHAYLAGRSRNELGDVRGLSFRDPDGHIVTTQPRDRLENLDEIPSPFLTGAIEMNDANGQFRYDVVLLETNRGCPYKCAFCYWGGATGQKVRSFSRDRLLAELDFFGFHKVTNVVLCDANFGMLKQDEQFVEDLIHTREKHGFPRNIETSWAKNKSKTFYSIVRKMKQTGFRSSFTLALQTLSDAALHDMQRKNMKLNDWESLAEWLAEEGLECYAELIWGAPGETYESFLEGYDRLAKHVSRIATYPMLLIPNTEYSNAREKYGLVAIRSVKDDFEYVLAHKTMTVQDNQKMHRFLFWARVVAENMIFRYIWVPLRELAGITQSQVLLSLDRWLDAQVDPTADGLKRCRAQLVDSLDASLVANGIRYFYLQPGVAPLLDRWWSEEILPLVPRELKDFFAELFRYDQIARPIYENRRQGAEAELPTEEIDGETYYVRKGLTFRYDVPRLVRQIKKGGADLTPVPREQALYYKVGFHRHIDNHEFIVQYIGKTRDELKAEAPVQEAVALVSTQRVRSVNER